MRNYQTKSNQGALPDSITSTRFGAGEFNSVAVELEGAVTTSGQTLAPADGTGEVTDQLAMALAIYGAGGATYHIDTGAVNAYVLTPVSPKESPNAFFNGFSVVFEPGTVNTTASTVNVGGLGVKSITLQNGTALTGGELSGTCCLKYNSGDDRFELIYSSDSALKISQYYEIDATQADQGATSTNPNTMTIYDVATLIGTSKFATIHLSHNPAAGNQTYYTFDTSLDLSTYPLLSFLFETGAIINRTTGDEEFKIYSPNNIITSKGAQIFGAEMMRWATGGDLYLKWFGSNAIGLQRAIDSGVNSSVAIRIFIPAGLTTINDKITLPVSGSDAVRNIKFIGMGGPNLTKGGSRLSYTGTDTDGLFDIDGSQDIYFENICFYNNSNNSIDQLIKIHSSSATAASAWGIAFNQCFFSNTFDSAYELNNGHVWIFNALEVKFTNCKFFGSPDNILLGADPTEESGIAAGGGGRWTFDCCYFTGDITIVRGGLISFLNSSLSEQWSNTGAEQSAQVYVPDETYTNVSGLSFLSFVFGGFYAPSVYNRTALQIEDSTWGVTVHACTFGEGYLNGIGLNNDVDSVDVRGNFADISGSGGSHVVSLGSGYTGRLSLENNHMSAAMVTDGGDMLLDNRSAPYDWPYIVDLNLASNYTIAAPDTWETVMTSGAVVINEGFYRIKASALIVGGATHVIGIRISSTGGYSSKHTECIIDSGYRQVLMLDDIAYLTYGASVTFSLQVREATAAAASVNYLSNFGVQATFLEVLPY